MIVRSTKITIVGLGLLGGSYAKGFFQAGYKVRGIDIDQSAVDYALKMHWIEDGGVDLRWVEDADVVIFALYPKVLMQWIKDHQHHLKSGAIITDVTGIKRVVIDFMQEHLRKDVEFIGAHPMAGREFKGIQYADCHLFTNANFIVVPHETNTQKAIDVATDIAKILKFQHISQLSKEEHDQMIGYLSQLTHVIAVSLMNANDSDQLVHYTGDSFRDLTRIAKINEQLWPELFILNKDYLLDEIDTFVTTLTQFRNAIEQEDILALQEKLIQSTKRRKQFDQK